LLFGGDAVLSFSRTAFHTALALAVTGGVIGAIALAAVALRAKVKTTIADVKRDPWGALVILTICAVFFVVLCVLRR
jgi:hypothetical protein